MAEQSVFEAAMQLLGARSGKDADQEEQARFPFDWLSDLSTDQARELSHLWPRLPRNTRRELMGSMDDEARENFELDFTAIARFALADSDPEVRARAVAALWECPDVKLAERFLSLMENDPESSVRAAAAAALGAFMERAVFEEIPAATGQRIEQHLIAVIRGGDDLEVRRKAVESIGFSSSPGIKGILDTAYQHAEERMRVSALFAMGRTADPYWSEPVLEELASSSPALRAEAARAAGELGLRKSVPILIDLLEDADPSVRRNAAGALGEIGGGKARQALERLQQHAEVEEAEWIEEALGNAEFQDSLGGLPLLDLGEEEEDEEE